LRLNKRISLLIADSLDELIKASLHQLRFAMLSTQGLIHSITDSIQAQSLFIEAICSLFILQAKPHLTGHLYKDYQLRLLLQQHGFSSLLIDTHPLLDKAIFSLILNQM